MRRVAIFGANGQLGRRLHEYFGPVAIPVTRARVDLEEPGLIGKFLASVAPDYIINAAAYTDVEGAESNEALAQRINAKAPAMMAQYAAKHAIPFVHFSTDYVFDGTLSRPYTEKDACYPINAYGRSKRAGEEAVLAAYDHAFVLRVSWLYDAWGKNFLNSIAAKARESEALRVVADQIGAPCFVRDIARATALLLSNQHRSPYRGVVHMANAGQTSWHGFAEAIAANMRTRESLPLKQVTAIASEEYPTKAQRPKNSQLNTGLLAHAFEITLPPWQDALTRCMKEWYAHR